MVEYQILYWHDIPVQVRAREKRERLSKPLSPRFQEAVDQAAMAAGLIGDDDYTELFQWSEPEKAEGSMQEVVDRVASELEAKHATIEWQKTVKDLARRRGANRIKGN